MRRHQVIWVCDRCGAEATVKAKTDTHPPDGWTQTHTDPTYDLCAACRGVFTALFTQFMIEVKQPDAETHTVIDDELSELDPETDNPSWDNPHPDGPS